MWGDIGVQQREGVQGINRISNKVVKSCAALNKQTLCVNKHEGLSLPACQPQTQTPDIRADLINVKNTDKVYTKTYLHCTQTQNIPFLPLPLYQQHNFKIYSFLNTTNTKREGLHIDPNDHRAQSNGR